MKRLIDLLVLGLVVAACAGGPTPDGSWILERGSLDGAPIVLLDSHPVTMQIDGSDLAGTAACNEYRGRARIAGSSFSVSEVAVTEMACLPPEVMDSEAEFLEAIADVATIEITDERLVLRGPRTELVFRAASS